AAIGHEAIGRARICQEQRQRNDDLADAGCCLPAQRGGSGDSRPADHRAQPYPRESSSGGRIRRGRSPPILRGCGLCREGVGDNTNLLLQSGDWVVQPE
ncbi:MAG: hypothetical protein ACK559_08735, partial [bacterium]